MLYPIVCRCGNSLGDLTDAFKLMRYNKIVAAIKGAGRGVSPDMFYTIEWLNVQLAEELNQLGLHMTCCRMAMVTSVEFPLWAQPLNFDG